MQIGIDVYLGCQHLVLLNVASETDSGKILAKRTYSSAFSSSLSSPLQLTFSIYDVHKRKHAGDCQPRFVRVIIRWPITVLTHIQ